MLTFLGFTDVCATLPVSRHGPRQLDDWLGPGPYATLVQPKRAPDIHETTNGMP